MLFIFRYGYILRIQCYVNILLLFFLFKVNFFLNRGLVRFSFQIFYVTLTPIIFTKFIFNEYFFINND